MSCLFVGLDGRMWLSCPTGLLCCQRCIWRSQFPVCPLRCLSRHLPRPLRRRFRHLSPGQMSCLSPQSPDRFSPSIRSTRETFCFCQICQGLDTFLRCEVVRDGGVADSCEIWTIDFSPGNILLALYTICFTHCRAVLLLCFAFTEPILLC